MSFHKAFENPRVFQYTQLLNPFTVGVAKSFVRQYVEPRPDRRALDVGCGVGVYSKLFPENSYIGVDINPDYIAQATRDYGDKFKVMDAGAMSVADELYDAAFTVLTCHHLNDAEVMSMISGVVPALKEGGTFHVIDALLPVSRFAPVKNLIFRNDRGRHQRTMKQMSALLASVATIDFVDLRRSVFHDVSYFRLLPRRP